MSENENQVQNTIHICFQKHSLSFVNLTIIILRIVFQNRCMNENISKIDKKSSNDKTLTEKKLFLEYHVYFIFRMK